MNQHDDSMFFDQRDPNLDEHDDHASPDESTRTWLRPGELSDHHLQLPNAHVVGTESFLDCQENLADTIEARGMAVMYGAAGTGKSLAVNAGLREIAPSNTVPIEFRINTLILTVAVGPTSTA